MTFHAADYDPRWPEIARQIRDQANDECEFCGVRNGAVGARDRSGVWHDWEADIEGMNSSEGDYLFDGEYPKIIRIVLTTAHLCWDTCRDKRCIDPTHLRSLCQRCHLNHDRPHHLAVQAQNRERRKREAIAATGQRELIP